MKHRFLGKPLPTLPWENMFPWFPASLCVIELFWNKTCADLKVIVFAADSQLWQMWVGSHYNYVWWRACPTGRVHFLYSGILKYLYQKVSPWHVDFFNLSTACLISVSTYVMGAIWALMQIQARVPKPARPSRSLLTGRHWARAPTSDINVSAPDQGCIPGGGGGGVIWES